MKRVNENNPAPKGSVSLPEHWNRCSLHRALCNSINAKLKNKSHKRRTNAKRHMVRFEAFARMMGFSNKYIWAHPREVLIAYHDHLKQLGYSPETIHTYISYVATGLNISMEGIAPHGKPLDRRNNTENNQRSLKIQQMPENQELVHFARCMCSRRNALTKLTGSCLRKDESGSYCVVYVEDKGGKTQFERILPEDMNFVQSLFEGKGKDELIFPNGAPRDLNVQHLRMEGAVLRYQYYDQLLQSPEMVKQLQNELLARFTNPVYGNKAYRLAKTHGNLKGARRHLDRFRNEIMNPKPYIIRGDNRKAAEVFGLPTSYNRLALMCVSVFALSHWRIDVTVKNYLLWDWKDADFLKDQSR